MEGGHSCQPQVSKQDAKDVTYANLPFSGFTLRTLTCIYQIITITQYTEYLLYIVDHPKKESLLDFILTLQINS